MKVEMARITLNIGGTVFQTTKKTLQKYRDGRLAKLSEQDDEYDSINDEYFFDRNPEIFNSILDFYRNGELHLPVSFCGTTLKHELEFWEIPQDKISYCCLQTFYKVDNDKETMNILQQAFSGTLLDYEEESMNSFRRIKQKIWVFLDQPTSSTAAQIFSIVYVLVVLLSMLIFVCSTHKFFRVDFDPTSIVDNKTFYNTIEFLDMSNSKVMKNVFMVPHPVLKMMDTACVAFFSIEVILHFATCPKLCKFFTHWLNVLDVFLIVVMWLTVFLETEKKLILTYKAAGIFYLLLRCLIILRPLRIFRLVKQYKSLKLLFLALRRSLHELCLMLISFMIASIMFAILIYYAEYTEPTTFQNAFFGIWWSVVTMTTVGYGDVVPKSFQGCVVGVMCSVFGILILAMPVAVVATSFNELHSKNKEREKFENGKKKSLLLLRTSSVSPAEDEGEQRI